MIRYSLIAITFLLVCINSRGQFITNSGIEIKNSALVITNGDWSNDAGTNIQNNGEIRTTKHFINNGTLDKASTGGFTLLFDTDLNFQPGGSQMGFLKKEGVGVALVRGTITAKDSLILKDGHVRLLDPKDTVSLKSGARLVAGETAYIEGGFIARAGKGDMLFPFGKDGLYLPLKIYKVQAQKVTASVSNAPPAHIAGPGVDALIGFPYAWKVTEKVSADTAGYVEIIYPNSLPVVSNPIVVREITGAEYASMGARLIENSGTRITVKSYSRRLNGLYTVAQGFPSDPVTDSLALVAIFNTTGGSLWINNSDWLTGPIDTWDGITVNGQSITGVDLSNNNLTGPLADQLVDIQSLQSVNLSGNKLSSVPDFTLNPEISSLNVMDNNLDFASLEPNASITGLTYIIQGKIGAPVDTAIQVGTQFDFSVPAGGLSSEFTWKRNGETVAQGPNATYTLPAISRANMGTYSAEVTNINLPGLILKSEAQNVLAHANVSGKFYADTNVPAQEGELTLFKVQPGAFEPIASVAVQNDGTYQFEKVILDDYQIRGFADTLTYERALPTYFDNTIFWEEADTVFLENNINDLDIVSQLEPGPPSGRGSISGYLQEDDGTGRIHDPEKNKRISNAGVCARRVERTGRNKEEIFTLVAYVFTNDDGEFTLPNLPIGEYRINFQYPGYPMDETSFTTILIGTAFNSQVIVEANVINDKINVRKLVITGLYEAEKYYAEVYPNPAVDHIDFRFGTNVRGRIITVSDMNGRTIQSVHAELPEISVNVKPFRKGLYVLRIRENGVEVKSLKVSIE